MKNIKMYSFYDKKAKRFDTPFFVFDEVGAKRHFQMSIYKEGTLMNTFKNDYELYYIADFDIENADLKVPETGVAELIMEGKEVQVKKDG